MGLIYHPLLKCSWAWSKSHWSERRLSVDFNGLCIRPRVSDSTQNFRACFLYNASAKRTILTLETTGSLHILLHSPAICIRRVRTAGGCVSAPRGINWRGERREKKGCKLKVLWQFILTKTLLESSKHQILKRPQHLTVLAWLLPVVFQNRIKYHLQCETCVILT